MRTLPNVTALQLMSEASELNSTSGGASQQEIEQWLALHNRFRCMHGAPDLVWNAAVARGAQEWANGLTYLMHDNTYHLSSPKGPCGENLAMNTAQGKDIGQPVESWYGEVQFCNSLPGCRTSSDPGEMVGHFTAVVWKGATDLGCGAARNNGKWFYVCRYKGTGLFDCSMPNMGGCYQQNVLTKVKQSSECAGGSGSVPAPPAATPPTQPPSRSDNQLAKCIKDHTQPWFSAYGCVFKNECSYRLKIRCPKQCGSNTYTVIRPNSGYTFFQCNGNIVTSLCATNPQDQCEFEKA